MPDSANERWSFSVMDGERKLATCQNESADERESVKEARSVIDMARSEPATHLTAALLWETPDTRDVANFVDACNADSVGVEVKNGSEQPSRFN